jgi:hypothetical protein
LSLLKKYLFWTYERGSFHYDVMVTLILMFIFISPHFIDFGDRPVMEERVHGQEVMVQASAGGMLVYQVSAQAAKQVGVASVDGLTLQQELAGTIRPIATTRCMMRTERLKRTKFSRTARPPQSLPLLNKFPPAEQPSHRLFPSNKR